jgi:hypothetical protein
VGNQYELPVLAAAPAATESVAKLDKVKWALIFIVPSRISNFLLVRVDQNQAPGSEQWFHSSIIQADITVQVT